MRANLTAEQCFKKSLYYDGLSREYMNRYLEKWEEENHGQEVEAPAVEDAGLGASSPASSAAGEPTSDQPSELLSL